MALRQGCVRSNTIIRRGGCWREASRNIVSSPSPPSPSVVNQVFRYYLMAGVIVYCFKSYGLGLMTPNIALKALGVTSRKLGAGRFAVAGEKDRDAGGLFN